MKNILKGILPIAFAVLVGVGFLIGFLVRQNEVVPQTEPPYFVGIHNIEIVQGDSIAYRQGVRAYDGTDTEIDFQVLASQVDINTPGVYTAFYIASDADGNTTKEDITVTVLQRPKIAIETLYALIDENIVKYGMSEMSKGALAIFLYSHIKQSMSFVSDSDKSDWVAEAYRALTEHEGDCFTYYAVARAYFERCGVETITVQRVENARPGTHYWLLVNMGTAEAPAYYHWDCCPHYMEYPLYSCLLTDEELLAYNEKVENYYLFDMELYPRTPKQPYAGD
ncbi:MAG: hypothetical protein IJW92_09310 [Clostridia bacterium]|nr:hypothetical protein [Clostridia bacterium]